MRSFFSLLIGVIIAAVALTIAASVFFINHNQVSPIPPVNDSVSVTTKPLVSGELRQPNLLLAIEPKQKTVSEGETLTISVMADPIKKISAIDLYLKYDPRQLKLEKAVPGNFFNNPREFSKKIDESSGQIIYSIGSLAPAEKKGSLASFTFRAVALSPKTIISIGEKTLASSPNEEEKLEIDLSATGNYSII